MYDRHIEGREFTFGVSGKLIRNVLVMYDRETESYWSQLLGEAVEGEMVGAKLEFLPSWMTTWEQWQEMHPNTLALDKFGSSSSRDTYASYYASDSAGVIGEMHLDDRLYTKEFVIGVALDDAPVAYPFSVLNEEPVVNDTVGDSAVVVVFDPATANGVVYSREVDGQTLTFDTAELPLQLIDAETATIWNAFTGEALSGPLVGSRLDRVKSTRSFWFGWSDFHPQTRLYGLE